MNKDLKVFVQMICICCTTIPFILLSMEANVPNWWITCYLIGWVITMAVHYNYVHKETYDKDEVDELLDKIGKNVKEIEDILEKAMKDGKDKPKK